MRFGRVANRKLKGAGPRWSPQVGIATGTRCSAGSAPKMGAMRVPASFLHRDLPGLILLRNRSFVTEIEPARRHSNDTRLSLGILG